jgi:4-amino-4-deoxy-L-arabinose transferase-like glycosyltransferase
MKKVLGLNLKWWVLLLIVLLAAFWRFYRLDTVPPSPSLDEVSIGWNAYSVLETGRDEYGTRLPVLLRAYDDYRPALYVYLVVPFVKLLGLSVWPVRLPAAILGVMAVLATFWLGKELFKQKGQGDQIGLLAAFLLAISPWHIYLSRLGHEVNAGVTLSLLAIVFFLKWLNFSGKKKIWWLVISVIFFAASFYTYQSLKIFLPVIVLGLLLIYRQLVIKQKKALFWAGIFGLVLIVPVVKASLSPEAKLRFEGTSLFANSPNVVQRASARLLNDRQNHHWSGLIFDNRRVTLGQAALKGYFSHFNPAWLFFNAGDESHKVPGLGLFYLWELPFLLFGAFGLVKMRGNSRSKTLLLVWVLAAPLSAAITTQSPHAMRFFNVLPVPQLLTSLGLVLAWRWLQIQKKFISRSVGVSGILILLISLLYLNHQYFVNFPFEQSDSFQLPLAKAVKYASQKETDYSQIIFSHHDQTAQAYMFYLFFNRFDPETYLASGGTRSAGFDQAHQIGNYSFRTSDWLSAPIDPKALYFGNPADFPEKTVWLNQFETNDGEVFILAVKGDLFLKTVKALKDE